MKKVILVLFIFIYHNGFSQQHADSLSIEEKLQYKQNAIQLITFLEGTLNAIGSPTTSMSEKEIMIYKSYTKFFRDENVQVEDDLDAIRTFPLNKDVQAYLKDIDFFFDNIKFTFTIKSADVIYNNVDKKWYVKITMNRLMNAVSADGTKINNEKIRYAEVNIDRVKKDLKIVSLYSVKISEDVDLKYWWNNLPTNWKKALGDGFVKGDSASIDELKLIVRRKSLIIDNNSELQTLEPLQKLPFLEEFSASNCTLYEISPVRYLRNVKKMNLSNNKIQNIESLANLTNLKELYLNDNQISDLLPLENLTGLKILDLHNNPLQKLDGIEYLENLVQLFVNQTLINDLSPISNLVELNELRINHTHITSIEPLVKLEKLEVLECYNTRIENLTPLDNIKKLKKLYFDNTTISKDTAKINSFKTKHPNCLIVYRTQELQNWWDAMSPAWKKYFDEKYKTGLTPSKEILHNLTSITYINASTYSDISDCLPLIQLRDITYLNLSGTSIMDISILTKLEKIHYLNLSNNKNIALIDQLSLLTKLDTLILTDTEVNSVDALKSNRELVFLDIKNTKIATIESISILPKLQQIVASGTPLSKDEPTLCQFVRKNKALVIFKSEELQTYWSELPEGWKKIFVTMQNISEKPTDIELHQLIHTEKINLVSINTIANLSPISKFLKIRELIISDCGLSDLTPLGYLTSIEKLDISKNTIVNIDALAKLENLIELNCENTLVENLNALTYLKKLKILKLSGTNIGFIKGLEPISKLTELEQLEIVNTSVVHLNYLDNLKKLKILKCYNTKIPGFLIERFKKSHPECKVQE